MQFSEKMNNFVPNWNYFPLSDGRYEITIFCGPEDSIPTIKDFVKELKKTFTCGDPRELF